MRTITRLTALALFMAAPHTTAHALTIDEFNGAGEASETQPGGVDYALITDSSAVGGTRALRLELISGIQGSGAEVLTAGGILTHSQVFGAIAKSLVTWDGDNNPQNLDPTGLGGIDFGQDDGDAIVLDFLGNDFEVTLRVTIYDSSDPSGGTFSRASLVRPAGGAGLVTIPFAAFSAQGPNGGASWNSVGAVTLEIDGQIPNLDLGLQSIRTNGNCTLVPNELGRVVDDCGVCGGSNQDKDDCGVCFGLNLDKDDCGVCFGNNELKDACGICGGDGSTCVACTEDDLTELKDTLIESVRDSRTCVRNTIRRVTGRDGSVLQQVRSSTKLFTTDMTKVVTKIRDRVVQCGNSLGCILVSIHEEELKDFRDRLNKFGKDMRRLLKDLREGKGGTCDDSVKQCRDRIRERARERRIARKKINECTKGPLVPLSDVPTSESECS
ncbi:MAG: hypothetical protein QY326_04025 [Bdellovibrionota bacterium]|nr:MAG: hypothetical protein QY326_04025 [Bdellovibrionota bacterium]